MAGQVMYGFDGINYPPVKVDTSGKLQITIAVNSTGTEGNLYNNVVVTNPTSSSVVDLDEYLNISIFGNSTSNIPLYVECSVDN
jgi:hypothetical protein